MDKKQQEKVGSFKLKLSEKILEQEFKPEFYRIASLIRQHLSVDPEIQQLSTEIEKYVSDKFKIISSSGKEYLPKCSIKPIRIEIPSFINDLLMLSANEDSRFKPRPFGNTHCIFLEIQKAGGTLKIRESQYLRFLRDAEVQKLLSSDLLVKKIGDDGSECSLSKGGEEFLANIKSRKNISSFTLGSEDLHRTFYAIVSGLAQDTEFLKSLSGVHLRPSDRWDVLEKLEFNTWILEEHQIIRNNALTKTGMKFLSSDIKKYLISHLFHTDWHIGVGPSPHIYLPVERWSPRIHVLDRKGDVSVRLVKADYTLLHTVPGIGATLLSSFPEARRDYTKILLQAKSAQEALDVLSKTPSSFMI